MSEHAPWPVCMTPGQLRAQINHLVVRRDIQSVMRYGAVLDEIERRLHEAAAASKRIAELEGRTADLETALAEMERKKLYNFEQFILATRRAQKAEAAGDDARAKLDALERREREWFNDRGEVEVLASADEVRERRKAAALKLAALERQHAESAQGGLGPDWHRACTNEEHDPQHGRISGFCVTCGLPWPCDTENWRQEAARQLLARPGEGVKSDG